jgi:hypothetical protein
MPNKYFVGWPRNKQTKWTNFYKGKTYGILFHLFKTKGKTNVLISQNIGTKITFNPILKS